VLCLTEKYLKGKSIAAYKAKGGSQFWKGLNKVKHNFKWRLNLR
jgi:hypothetical protein